MLYMRKSGIELCCAIAFVFLLSGCGRASDPFDSQTFDSTTWRNAHVSSDRAPMARDLIRNHLRPGVSAKVVEELLGAPERVPGVNGEVDGFGNRLQGVRTFCYYLGSWSNAGLDTALLYVHFDGNDQVLSAEITGG